MKNIILFTAFALSSILAKDNTALIKVDGMVCNYSCSGKVSSIVQNINGVKECSVDFEKGIATVVYDDKKIEEKDIVEGLITNTQYKAVLLDNNKTTPTVGKI
jgi:copper chaperone CopZ